ncbi:hypothetical protein SUGI_0044050 [Cryptomeria japonica]|nr:hypothetical protein SUGI_0044050 [Cryptomeria japonica]
MPNYQMPLESHKHNILLKCSFSLESQFSLCTNFFPVVGDIQNFKKKRIQRIPAVFHIIVESGVDDLWVCPNRP